MWWWGVCVRVEEGVGAGRGGAVAGSHSSFIESIGAYCGGGDESRYIRDVAFYVSVLCFSTLNRSFLKAPGVALARSQLLQRKVQKGLM